MPKSLFSLIIPAAGSGTRMGRSHNKLFIPLAGKPILWHTLTAFDSCEGLKEIILAVRPEDRDDIQNLLDGASFKIPIRIVLGGITRQESVYNALRTVDSRCETVWVHDGARPFIQDDMLERLRGADDDRANAVLAVPAKDTIKETDEKGFVTKTPDRSRLWSVQTPQVFRKSDLLAANQKALAADFNGTDDASLLEWAGYPVSVILGDYFNIKITTPEDLVLAEAILAHFQRSGQPCG